MVEGMATTRPTTVVSRAEEMPGARAAMSATPLAAIVWKASITPHTVPKRPRSGAEEVKTASAVMPRPNFMVSSSVVWAQALSTSSMRTASSRMGAPGSMRRRARCSSGMSVAKRSQVCR